MREPDHDDIDDSFFRDSSELKHRIMSHYDIYYLTISNRLIHEQCAIVELSM
jgi:hypothetical protein